MSSLVPASSTEFSFAELNLSGPLLQAIESAGYLEATPIQARAIPPLLAGRDVLGQAQTGTGKTAAFAVPMLQAIDLERKVPQVLVLTPTRELAIQVADSFSRYAGGLKGFRVVPIYGGQDYQAQFRALDRGVHVVVGTPGRVIDHIRRGSLKLEDLRGLVLDEADEMLQMGFAEDVEWILEKSPPKRQIALFSATMPVSIRRIAQRHLKDPAEITIKQTTSTAATVRQRFVVAGVDEKRHVLARLLEAEPIEGVLIFVNTKSSTEPLAEYLSSQGHRTAALSGDVAQSQRERIIDNLRSGKTDVVIATDVAARGLDVQRISHVINYDFPTDSESYVHRIGRTGRAGRSGNAILFLHPRGRHLLKRLEHVTHHVIEQMDIPSADAINERRIHRFHQRITAAMTRPDLQTFTKLLERYRAENDVPLEMVAAALAALASGDTPLLLPDDEPESEPVDPRYHQGRSAPRGREQVDEGDRHQRSSPRGQRVPTNGRRRNNGLMETFRIEVGHAHFVKATNIVGAIANEAGVDSRVIGQIEIFDEHSTVELQAGMPRHVFDMLKLVKIAGRRLNIARLDGPSEPELKQGGESTRPAALKSDGSSARKSKPGGAASKLSGSGKSFHAVDRRGRPAAKKYKFKPKSKYTASK